jgi:hypothetical protein
VCCQSCPPAAACCCCIPSHSHEVPLHCSHKEAGQKRSIQHVQQHHLHRAAVMLASWCWLSRNCHAAQPHSCDGTEQGHIPTHTCSCKLLHVRLYSSPHLPRRLHADHRRLPQHI